MAKRPYPWKCGKCRERRVNPVTVDYRAELEHDGRTYPVACRNLEILRCEACGNEMLPDEAYAKLNEALRFHAGLLMPSQIAEKRMALGLSQREFARLLGVASETVCRWENGGQIQQRVMNDLMNAFFKVPELREYLRRLRGLQPGVPQVAVQAIPSREPATNSEAVLYVAPARIPRLKLSQAFQAIEYKPSIRTGGKAPTGG